MTSGARKCPKCGAELHDGVLGGLCPACATRLVCQTGGVGEAPALVPADGKPQAPTDVVPLRYFGDYELLGEVGRGGMGVVYRARQLSLSRVVALKLIAPEQLASPKAVERFHTEAEAAAHLDHPNIVPIYETGERDGRLYFSMKLIEGKSLAQRIADFRLPSVDSKPARPDASPSPGGEGRGEGGRSAYAKSAIRNRQSAIAEFLAKVADTVHYAHQRGILHRDLKPGNILIDSAGEPHVTDFGLAKLVEGDSSLTLSGEVLGTPAYMAPEQAAGNTKQMTTAADIYSLGVILYELLTGRTPFRGETPVETLYVLLHTEPEAPRSLNCAVPRDLETICLKCLEKEPARRYTSARALAEDLRRFIDGEPVQARPIGAAGKVWRWCRRKPALAATLVLLQMVLAFGLMGIVWQWHSARQKEVIARENLYAADIGAAKHALDGGNLRQAVDLLHKQIPKPSEPDLRGFEWRYLWHHSQGEELFSLAGHQRQGSSVAFSPNGRMLATGSWDRTVKLWDIASHRVIATLIESNRVESVSFSPHGDLLAAASKTSVRLWDTKSFQPLRRLSGAVLKMRFSPDGHYLVAGTTNGLALWDTGRWSICRTVALEGLWGISWDDVDGNDFGLAFSPNGNLVAVVSDAGVALLRLPDLQLVAVLKDRMPRIRFVAFSSDEHTLATCTSVDRNVKLWNIDGQRELGCCFGHSDSVYAAAFAPDGKRLATCSADQTVKLWDATGRKLLRTFRGHVGEVWDVAFSQDGNLLASVCQDGTIKFWNCSPTSTRDLIAESVRPLGFTADGDFLALLTNGTLTAFDPETIQAERVCYFRGRTGQTNRWFGSLLSHGHILPVLTAAPFHAAPALELWDLGHQQLLCSVPALDPFPAYAPRRHLLATATKDHTVSLWQLPQGMLKFVLTNCTERGGLVAFSADEALLGTEALLAFHAIPLNTTPRIGVKLWTVGENKVHEFAVVGRVEPGDGLAFSPDSRVLASGEYDGSISLWGIPSGARVGTLTGHTRAGIALSFSPDGLTLASAADDRTVRLWHLASQRELMSLEGSISPNVEDFGDVRPIAFSPGGRAVFATEHGFLSQLRFAPSFAEIAVAEGKDYRSVAQDAATWHAVGKALEKRSRSDEAEEAFQQAIQHSANQPDLEPLRNSALRHRAKLLVRLGRLSEAAADNLAALNLPPRGSRAPMQSLDLSAHFNGTLDWNSLYLSIPPERFLTDLPRGLQRLLGSGGIQFDVRGVVQLNNDADFPGFARAVEGIAIRQKCRRLHFLHATHGSEKEGTQIGAYVLHYADGQQEEVPIAYGRDLHAWVPVSTDAADLQGAKVAWKGENGHRVYMTTWENPRPDMEIASLAFVSKLTKCGPFLIAITAEP